MPVNDLPDIKPEFLKGIDKIINKYKLSNLTKNEKRI